jgi:diguanylate cyclase (GGDEF)-like protein/PAS domain S-box-containing protein
VAVAYQSFQRVRAQQEDMADLITLRERIDDFSVASDSMLLYRADPRLWRAFRDEGRALQERLRALGERHPGALKAAHRVDVILESLAEVRQQDGGLPRKDGVRDPHDRPGQLDLPLRARILLNRVASHGIALDTALDDVMREGQRAIAREAWWIAGSFAGAAALFAALCVLAFTVIHRRVSRPVTALAATIQRIRAGDESARVPVSGNDELAELAAEFNRLADARAASDARVRDQQAELQYRERMLARSQQIARVGTWRLHLEDDSLEWSEETYALLGVSPGDFTPTPQAFVAFVHPDDRAVLQAKHDRILRGEPVHDLEFRIVRADGEVRHVHERAEAGRAPDGAPVFDGTIQDITERRLTEERLQHYRRLIEGSNDLFCIVDARYRYVFANEAYAALYQLDSASIEGRDVVDVVGEPFFAREAKPPIDRCLAGEPQRFEAEREYAHLGRREFLVRYYPLRSPDHGIDQVGAVLTDITELRESERELRKQSRLLSIAGEVARFGGWSVDLLTGEVQWSNVVCEIHDVPHGYSPSIDEGVAFYAPEYRDGIRERFRQCGEEGRPIDEEVRIVTTGGERVWVHCVGRPVRDEAGEIVRVEGAFQDITAQKEVDLELERLNERLSNILESITDAFLTVDREWTFQYVNAEAGRIMGHAPEDLVGRNAWEMFPGGLGTEFEHEFGRAMEEHVSTSLEAYYEPLGAWLDIRVYPTNEGLALYFHDITERRELTERLRAQEASLRASRDELAATLESRQALINALPAHIALLDREGTILDVNDQWRHYGRERAAHDPAFGVGTNYLAICEAATGDCAEDARRAREAIEAVLAGNREHVALEYPCHGPDEERWFRLMANGLHQGHAPAGETGAVVMHVDITERKVAERELNRAAYEDPLTGSLSRHGFVRRLEETLAEGGWQPDAMIAMLNIHNQRDVNDAYGHQAGDRVLIELGERLRAAAGDGALVGRPGGDEFALYLPPRPDLDPGARREAVARAFDQPISVGHVSIQANAHFGFTRLGSTPRSADELMREAAVALFKGRQGDRPRSWDAYTPAIDAERRERVGLTQDLQRALDQEEFQLHFQPKVELASGELVAAEALIRWYHPERGLQSPGRFIPVAEQSQLIGPIGDWAVRQACTHLEEWRAAGLDIVRIAVNVSQVQFVVGDFAATVRDALDAHGLEPGHLTLEITESVFEKESEELHRQLEALHDLGVRLSLDDFGTGYSSLLYLQRYPFDEIKIDQAFVRSMLTDAYSRRIVDTVLALSDALGAEPIAEGVEDAEVRDALVSMGCRIGQGFFYSVPLEVEDFRWLLEQRSALPLAGDASG